jgi:hypothetical protein
MLEIFDLIRVAQNGVQWLAIVDRIPLKVRIFNTSYATIKFSRRTRTHAVTYQTSKRLHETGECHDADYERYCLL